MSIFNQWLNWISPKPTNTISQNTGISLQYIGGQTPRAPETVTPENALNNPTIFVCVSLLCQTIAQLPWGVCKRDEVGFKEVTHPINDLLSKPNNSITEFELKHIIVSDLLLYGNAYLLKVVTSSGKVIELIPLSPENMTPIVSASGKQTYRNANGTIYPAEKIIHIRDFIGSSVHGLSKVKQAATAIAKDNAIDNSIIDNFSNGTAISGVVSFPEAMPPEVKQGFGDAWAKKFGGKGTSRGSVAVLDNGATFTQVESISPADADLRELKMQTMAQIAAVFRIPSTFLNINDSAKYNNLSQFQAGFYRDTISPIIQNIAQKLTASLIDDPNLEIEFSTDDLIKGDMTSAVKVAVSAVGAGLVTVNEARDLIGYSANDTLPQMPSKNSGSSVSELDDEPRESKPKE